MRRVIDDTHYTEIADKIYEILKAMPADEVNVDKGGWAGIRPTAEAIAEYISERLENARIGKNISRGFIGNNHSYEIIYTGDPKEEQLCGILRANEDPAGGVYCYVMDYDEKNRWNYPVRFVHMCNPNFQSNMEDEDRRFGGWEMR